MGEKVEKENKLKALVKAMDDALVSIDTDKIKAAIADAKSGGVDAKETERVEHQLKDMLADSAKMEKMKALGEAVQTKEVAKVKAAIDAARAAGLADKDLVHY